MTCIAPSTESIFHSSHYAIPERIGWVRKHCIEEFYSDEELHPEMQEKQSLDRLKEIHDLSMRATLLNAEQHRYSDESITPNNRKRRIAEYNSSPDRNSDYHPLDDGRYKLTLSQFAVSASEQEPLYPDDEDVEEILMRLRHGHDYYRPQVAPPPPPPSFPSLLFAPHNQMRNPFYPRMDHHHHISPPIIPTPNKASLFHILSQEPDHLNNNAHHHHHHHLSVHNNIQMRKLFFDESGLMESSDELDLDHPKKKARREVKVNKSPMKSIIVNSNDDVQEKETISSGLCFKTHKPKVQREYYYAKLSKTIFRWTCCGSQAKTHPDA